MGKRIAIIISIIIASVAAFTGGVFGVLALMGKFDEKIIYPTSLEFDANCKIEYDSSEDKLYSFVLHGYNNEDKNAGYAVNQKLCYLDVKDDAKLITLCHEDGRELTEKSKQGYYIVNCNEPIYYKVNEDSKVDSSKVSSSTFGCVSFTAKDSRNLVKTDSNNPFIIWIDRQVKGVYVDLPEEYGTEAEYLTTEGTSYKEILTVNVGTKVYFTFESLFRGLAEKTSASYSLCPIKTPTNTITIQEESVKVGEKIVEIYDKDFNKYENGIESENGDYIRYDKNRQCWYFDSELSGTGTFGGFKIAVFDTYDARTNYLAQQEASEQKDSPAQRISKMVSTNLEFKVESSNITDVKFNTTEIGLDLYADYMQITLNADREEQGKTNRNLGLDIKESGGESKRYNEINFNSTLDDVIRTDYDEIRFVDNSGNEIIYDQSVGITLGEGEDEDKAFFYLDGQEYTIHFDKSNVTLPGDRKLVGNITTEDEHTITYTAKTGRVVLTKTSSTSGVMNVISVGSYLSFYYLNTQTQTYRPATNFEYTATQVAGTQGKGKTWDVVVKTTDDMGEENEVLTLGLLMINSVDLDHLADAIPWWFKTTNVRVEPVDLLYKNLKYLKGQNIDLPVTYQLNGESTYDTIYSELSFDEIIAISPEDGEHWPSYTSCVFVTSVDNNIVETLPEYTLNLTDLGRNFVLVGHIENGHFVNSVKIKEGANAQTSLYVLQLKNKFGENTIQTIDRVIKGEETLNSLCGAVDISEGYAVRVSPKYELLNKEGLVAFTFNASRKELIVNGEDETGKPTVSVYAGNVDSGYGYTLTITTAVKGMINNIMNMLSKEEQERAIYFALNENDTKVSGINNIKIDSFDYNAEEEKIVVYFYTEDAIAEGNYFRLCFNYNGVIVKSNRIYILSTDATDIRFNDKNQEIDDEHPFEDLTALPTSIEEAESSDLYIKISVSMMPDYSGYKFTYSANGLELDPTDDATIFKGWFNANCTIGTKSGFVALPLIVTGHNFVYSVEKADKDDKDIIRFNYASGELKDIEVVGLGSAYIRIKSSISRYIKVVVELEENTNFNFVVPSEINSNNETSISTRNNITYEYNNGTTTKELTHSQFVTLSGIGNVQYGELGAKSYPVEATEDGYDVYVQFEDRKEKLLTITKDGGYWKFARTEYNPNSSLSLDVSFATLTNSEVQTSTLIFTSVVTIDYGT
ncbi:MAG: hypothetical protein MJ152_01540, partial [Clostridia bacterium]|nr:hypothetical protein [Clostridia bacterium]